MSDTLFCSVSYYKHQALCPTCVTVNRGSALISFDCLTCAGFVCCGLDPDPVKAEACYKCSCQGIGTFETQCIYNSTICNGNCDPSKYINIPAPEANLTVETMSCPTALAFLQTPYNYVQNPESVVLQCNPVTRLQCCQGNVGTNSKDINQINCGPLWVNCNKYT